MCTLTAFPHTKMSAARELQRNIGTVSRRAFCSYRSAERLHNAFNDRQPQSRTACASGMRRISAVKAFKHMRKGSGFYPGTIIGKFKYADVPLSASVISC